MADARPEFHFYEDLSLTPAYVLGYAFHALARIDPKTSIRGRRGALVLLNELFATLTSLQLDASLLAAEPLRVQQQAMASRSRVSRIGPVSATEIANALPIVELCVREELRGRAGAAGPKRRATPLSRLQTLLGNAALGQCPEALRCEVTEACRALDAQLYTAAVFHLYRVWEGLPGRTAPAAGCVELPVADPRVCPTLRCSKDEAASVFEAIRCRLEGLCGSPDSLG